MTLLQYAPAFSLESAAKLAKDLYNISGCVTQLPSERDQNFLLTTSNCRQLVLKIANSKESRALLEAQNMVMSYLQSKVTFCSFVLPALSGETIVETPGSSSAHYVRMVSYIPGVPLAKTEQSREVLFDLGSCLGKWRLALSDFDNDAFHRDFHWDLANGLEVVSEYVGLVPDDELRRRLDEFATQFSNLPSSQLQKLRRSVIHGDANDYNVLVEDRRVAGLIDFGDMIHSYTVGDLAIAMAYTVLNKSEPLDSARPVVAGYLSRCLLDEDEVEVLWWLMLLRLCMSICLAAYQLKQNPENEYLDVSQRSIRSSLPALLTINPEFVADEFRRLQVINK